MQGAHKIKYKTMLDARVKTEKELEEENPTIRKMYKRIPFVYAHGELEEDWGTDILYLFLGNNVLCNGLVAYTKNGEPVRFHLYRHPETLQLTGIVTYASRDKESYEYGEKIIKERP